MLLSTCSSLSSKKQTNQHKKISQKRNVWASVSPPSPVESGRGRSQPGLAGTVGSMETVCWERLAQMAPGFGLGKHGGQIHQQCHSPVAIPAATLPGVVGEGGRSAGGSPLAVLSPTLS